MDLITLAQEYFQQEQEIKKMILERKKALKRISDPFSIKEHRRNILILYQMCRECHSTGVYLKNYYNREDD